jgi:hypothetical protein
MCIGANPDEVFPKLNFNFDPIQTKFKLYDGDVQGYGVDSEPSQADADATSAALEGFYATLPPEQQAVLARVILQASSAVG